MSFLVSPQKNSEFSHSLQIDKIMPLTTCGLLSWPGRDWTRFGRRFFQSLGIVV